MRGASLVVRATCCPDRPTAAGRQEALRLLTRPIAFCTGRSQKIPKETSAKVPLESRQGLHNPSRWLRSADRHHRKSVKKSGSIPKGSHHGLESEVRPPPGSGSFFNSIPVVSSCPAGLNHRLRLWQTSGLLRRGLLQRSPKGFHNPSRWLSRRSGDTTGMAFNWIPTPAGRRTRARRPCAIPSGSIFFSNAFRWCRPAGLNHRLGLWNPCRYSKGTFAEIPSFPSCTWERTCPRSFAAPSEYDHR
jgi:hypothetical protein